MRAMSPEEGMMAVSDLLGTVPRRVYIATFGCQQNEADSEKLRGMAYEMGYVDADAPEDADLILLNTCAIREHAEQKELSYIGTLKAIKAARPALIIGVCGCMTAQGHRVETLRDRYPYVSFTIDPASLSSFPAVLYGVLKEGKRKFIQGTDAPPVEEGLPIGRLQNHRAWVSIMYGCNNFCSYCIVPYVRGRERSRASIDIIREVEELVKDGCHDITLLGQNVNSYHGDCDFATLLTRIAELPGDFIVRFMTSHPKDVSDALIEAIATHPSKIAPHFHLPMQSGSDEILKRMNRHYDRVTYLDTVRRLRERVAGIAISTDIIIGFPGETDEDFSATMEIIRTVRFDMIYAFLYSPRKGTPAAEMEGQVTADVRKERMAELLATQNEITCSLAQPYLGQTVRVLADGNGKKEGELGGRTGTNRQVYFPAPKELIGQFVNVKIERVEPYALHGVCVPPVIK